MLTDEEIEAFAELQDKMDDQLAALVKQIEDNFRDATSCETPTDAMENLKELRKAAFEIAGLINEKGEIDG